jgi:hypothetical protein
LLLLRRAEFVNYPFSHQGQIDRKTCFSILYGTPGSIDKLRPALQLPLFPPKRSMPKIFLITIQPSELPGVVNPIKAIGKRKRGFTFFIIDGQFFQFSFMFGLIFIRTI